MVAEVNRGRLRRPGRALHAVIAAAAGVILGSPAAQAQVGSGVTTGPDSTASQPVPDLPRERYEEWVREWVDSWQSRDVEMVLGQEWRDAAAGRDLLEALRQTDLPLERWEPHPRFAGRICPRTRSSSECATVSHMTHGRRGDLRDVSPSEIEAVIWIGPTISSGPSVGRMAWDAQYEVERVILFSRGYLGRER